MSFYNQTGATPINPTPVVGVLGLLSDVAARVPMGFSSPGDEIFLLGETREELSGSEWAHVTHAHLGGRPPQVDLAAEQRLAGLMADGGRAGHLGRARPLRRRSGPGPGRGVPAPRPRRRGRGCPKT